jgi:hypothetical protein
MLDKQFDQFEPKDMRRRIEGGPCELLSVRPLKPMKDIPRKRPKARLVARKSKSSS